MYCKQCGKELKNDLKFCPYCGKPVRAEEAAPSVQEPPAETSSACAEQAPAQPENSTAAAAGTAVLRKKKWMIPALIGLVLILVAAVLFFAGKGAASSAQESPWTLDELYAQFPGISELHLTQATGDGIDAVYSVADGQTLICSRAISSASGKAVLAAVRFDANSAIIQVAFRAAFESDDVRTEIESPLFAERFENQAPQLVDVSDLGASGEAAKQAVQAAADHINAEAPQPAPAESLPAEPEAASSSTAEPASASSPLDGMQPLSSTQDYHVASGAGSLRIRTQPNTDAEIVELMYEGWNDPFYVLKEENGWAYGVYVGQAGWTSMEYLTPDEPSYAKILPDFLSPELQCRYLQAATLYDATRWGSSLRDFSTEVMIDGLPFCKIDLFLGQYANYEAAVRDLFTGEHVDTAFFNGHFKNYNGELYESSGDGGSILSVDLQSYSFRLESQTEDTIIFTLIGNYNGYGQNTGESGPYTQEWPITMVKESDGQWRFTQFASPLNGDLGF